VHRGTDGAFAELLRFDDSGEVQGVPGFCARQWSWSLLEPGAVKAWHLHLGQDDLWIVPPDSTVLVGLVDLRRESPTANEQLRLTLGGGRCHRLFIPRGVAHGVANLSTDPQVILYAVNRHFSPDPSLNDEWRLPADCFGSEFWRMDRN
jgi:dTDP-4-dehydrorhamnose 3,5-epimerase